MQFTDLGAIVIHTLSYTDFADNFFFPILNAPRVLCVLFKACLEKVVMYH